MIDEIPISEINSMDWPLKIINKCYCLRVDEITFKSRQSIHDLIEKYTNKISKGNDRGHIVTIHRAMSEECMYGQHEKKCECNVTHAVKYTLKFNENHLIITNEPIMPWKNEEYEIGYHVEPNPYITTCNWRALNTTVST